MQSILLPCALWLSIALLERLRSRGFTDHASAGLRDHGLENGEAACGDGVQAGSQAEAGDQYDGRWFPGLLLQPLLCNMTLPHTHPIGLRLLTHLPCDRGGDGEGQEPATAGLEEQLLAADAKVVDFGNACWTYKQFTSDVQTRQYRCPEVSPAPRLCQKSHVVLMLTRLDVCRLSVSGQHDSLMTAAFVNAANTNSVACDVHWDPHSHQHYFFCTDTSPWVSQYSDIFY